MAGKCRLGVPCVDVQIKWLILCKDKDVCGVPQNRDLKITEGDIAPWTVGGLMCL